MPRADRSLHGLFDGGIQILRCGLLRSLLSRVLCRCAYSFLHCISDFRIQLLGIDFVRPACFFDNLDMRIK